ncbi:hypothetical protein GCM10008995_29400 [Halobellus salinus]|uniref:Uncharacterized protein n=1 Tax=Halobellus salinus TaxID=931585 RepID=A0A830EEY0_9EURY|nr:hypothetical protein GCM10008995_29400 [Halobellus salinus]
MTTVVRAQSRRPLNPSSLTATVDVSDHQQQQRTVPGLHTRNNDTRLGNYTRDIRLKHTPETPTETATVADDSHTSQHSTRFSVTTHRE